MKRSQKSGIYKVIRVLCVGIFILLFLGSLGWVYRSNFLTGSLEVELAKQGSIDHLQTVPAVFANEETLLKAPSAGTPVFLVEEGEKVRKGDPVAVIQSEGVALGQDISGRADQVYAPIGGLVFSSIDGLETFLTPENLLNMDVNKILQQTATTPDTNQNGEENRETEGEQGASAPQVNQANQENQSIQANQSTNKSMNKSVASGKIIGKIVNNLKPTVAILKVSTKGHEVGKSVRLIINDQSYSAKVLRLLDNPEGLVVQFNQYINGTSQQRLTDISLVVKPSVSGVLIPKSSLWIKGEEHGVYVVQQGAIQYRKVKILDKNDQVVCVENLPHGIPVITNPRDGLDGLIMNLKNAS